jgi:hypothetical protein
MIAMCWPALAAKEDHPRDVGPGRELLAQDGRRAVAAAVIDEDDFVAFAKCVQRRIEAGEERGEAGFLVVDGYDDGEGGGRHAISDSEVNVELHALDVATCAGRLVQRCW